MGKRATLADQIRAAIRDQGWTKRELSKAMATGTGSMHEASVGRFVNGPQAEDGRKNGRRGDIRLSNAERLFEILGFTVTPPAKGRRKP